jgi:hypothetical protein
MSELKRRMIEAIRDLQARVATLEARTERVYDRCEQAEATIPACVALGDKGGIVVTPWHAIGAWHHQHAKGATIRYQWGTRRVARVQQAGNTDIAVYTLDSLVPDEVEPARYLPWDWHRHFPTDVRGERLRRWPRALATKADGSLWDSHVSSLGADFGGGAAHVVKGDSGQPLWLPLAQPVLIGCWLLAGTGPSVAWHQEAIRRCTVLDANPAAMMEADW